MNLRQAAQQALEALMMMRDKCEEYACPEYACPACDHADAAITTLRKALAEPEQPVEYVRDENNPCYMFTAPTPQPEQEPQTTHWEGCEAVHPECRKPDTDCHAQGICQRSGYSIAPTPRKPLTEDEIADLWDGHTVPVFGKTGINPIVFARAIERAHGITGDSNE